MIKNIKTWITWEWSITFLRNKKILYLCLTWHILRSYRFDADVTFKVLALKVEINLLNQHFKPYEWLADWLTTYWGTSAFKALKALKHLSHTKHSDTRALETFEGHLGTRAIKVLKLLKALERHLGIRRALRHSGTQGTWKALRHVRTQWTWALEALGHSKGTWAFRHSRYLGTWSLRHLGTWTLERHLGTWALGHSSTRALETFEALYLADSITFFTLFTIMGERKA